MREELEHINKLNEFQLVEYFQDGIITIYHTLEACKKINAQLKDSIKPLCPVLMRGVVESLEL